MSKTQIRKCLEVHGDELECAVCAPPDRWPNRALIVEPGACLVISMPGGMTEEEQENSMAHTKSWANENGLSSRVLVIFGADQLAVVKPPPMHPTQRDLNQMEGP
jgi:hypothetical protein